MCRANALRARAMGAVATTVAVVGDGDGEDSGPMYAVAATAPPQYHVTGWSAVIPPPIETWSMPALWSFTKPVALRVS